MLTFILLIILGLGLFAVGIKQTNKSGGTNDDSGLLGIGFGIIMIVASIMIPLNIHPRESSSILIEEYNICEYEGAYYYIDDGEIKPITNGFTRISDDGEVHVRLEKLVYPKSIWYFYSKGDYVVSYIPLECK